MIQINENTYFLCDECPLISHEDIQRRLNNWEICGEFQFDHLGCEKISCAFFSGGYCEDAFREIKKFQKNRLRKSGREYRRYQNHRKKTRKIKLATTTVGHNFPGYVDYTFDNGHIEYVGTYTKLNYYHNKKFFKRQSNRYVRHYQHILPQKGAYKKCFDLWWLIS